MTYQLIAGLILFSSGLFFLFYPVPFFSNIVYPIIWWGLIILIDNFNFRFWKSSPIRSSPINFLGVIVPLSVIYWLYYEYLNFYFPQWYYIGIIEGMAFRIILTIFSFGTVIPIMAEIFWLISGPITAPQISPKTINFLQKYYFASIIFGIIFLILPFFSDYFWLNQMMWLGSFFIILPFLYKGSDYQMNLLTPISFLWKAAIAGIMSGFLWEMFNFAAGGKWKYIILPEVRHIFEMPIYGYFGFAVFAYSTIAVYLLFKQLRSRFLTAAIFYLAAFYFSYLFVKNLPTPLITPAVF